MSVSQVKKRFAEFESYLGRDKEGLRRLKLLKDDVNVLRTSLAAAEEAKQLAETIKDAARDRADKAETEAYELRLEVDSLRQRVANLMRDLEAAAKPDKAVIDIDDTDRMIEVGKYSEARRTIKALRKVMPHCPRQTGDYKQHIRTKSVAQYYLRHQIADGWSHMAMWKLGASVALIAAENGQVTIVDPVGVSGLERDDKTLDGFAFNFLTWFKNNTGVITAREKSRQNKFDMKYGDKLGDSERTTDFVYGEADK